MGELYLWKREYTPRLSYKYLNPESFVLKKQELTGRAEENFLKVEVLETLKKSEKAEFVKMELEAFKHFHYAVAICEIKSSLLEKLSSIEQSATSDISKLPLDIYYDIIEADYIFKKVGLLDVLILRAIRPKTRPTRRKRSSSSRKASESWRSTQSTW